MKYFVTFAEKYRFEAHPLDSEVTPDGYCSVEAGSYEEANLRAFAKFNAYFSGVHAEDSFEKALYPDGQLFSF